jgi:hypothetical protein
MEECGRIVVTSCFGAHWAYAERWARHTRFKCDLPVHIVSVDGEHLADDFGDGVFIHPAPTLSTSARDAEAHRLEFIAGQLASGTSCAQVDLDVLLKRGINDLFRIEADLILSRALRLPEFMAAAFGFVACPGFLIAKPPAADLCAEVVSGVRERRYGNDPDMEMIDQYVLNRMFFDEILAGAMKPFTQAPVRAGRFGEPYLVSEYRGTRVAILAEETILRGGQLGRSTYGIHHPDVLLLFGRDEA